MLVVKRGRKRRLRRQTERGGCTGRRREGEEEVLVVEWEGEEEKRKGHIKVTGDETEVRRNDEVEENGVNGGMTTRGGDWVKSTWTHQQSLPLPTYHHIHHLGHPHLATNEELSLPKLSSVSFCRGWYEFWNAVKFYYFLPKRPLNTKKIFITYFSLYILYLGYKEVKANVSIFYVFFIQKSLNWNTQMWDVHQAAITLIQCDVLCFSTMLKQAIKRTNKDRTYLHSQMWLAFDTAFARTCHMMS